MVGAMIRGAMLRKRCHTRTYARGINWRPARRPNQPASQLANTTA